MMKKANRLGARYVLLLGENEQKDGTVTIKQMLTGVTNTVKQSALLTALQ